MIEVEKRETKVWSNNEENGSEGQIETDIEDIRKGKEKQLDGKDKNKERLNER